MQRISLMHVINFVDIKNDCNKTKDTAGIFLILRKARKAG